MTFHYTLGPAIRIPYYKNMGKDLAPEELRICPLLAGGPAGQQNFAILDANTQKSFKKIARCARQGRHAERQFRPPLTTWPTWGVTAGKLRPRQNDALNT